MNESESKEVQAIARQDRSPIAIVGNSVYDPLLFSRRIVPFSRRQYLFLNAYRLGVPLAKAAEKVGWTVKQADYFLSRPNTRAWIEDRAKKDAIRDEWAESNKWVEMGNDVLEGKKHLSKDQQVVYLEFGKRFCPEQKFSPEVNKGPTINFNFSAEAVQEAFRRQNAIDAEIA